MKLLVVLAALALAAPLVKAGVLARRLRRLTDRLDKHLGDPQTPTSSE